ncbi:MFS transporter [Comamonas sp. NLF-1-9]|uniref:MFS transporter n=1 Tax=Comamonas sp. NLF-1-9 TaxID=2853163 RepID=UPI001C47610B|nr:MFS transporter [Comamonas sp. NLF-1-9]QXL85425.1 MFS transporter [Comamonas sp. NLF-1-9]
MAPDAEPPHGDDASAPGDVPRVRIFLVIALALLMMSVDSTIVATALHALQHGLGTTINWAGWTLTAYSLGFVVAVPITGKLSERYGRRRVFIASVVVFTLASLLCGLATNIYTLIALRVLQAAGGAGFTPSATGIIVDHFGSARDRAVSLFGSIFPIGAMIGPIFGGLFVNYWDWRGVFLVNVPIGAVILFFAWRLIPHDRKQHQSAGSMDVTGMALLAACVLGGMLGVNYLGERGVSFLAPLVWAPLAVSVLAGWAFVRHLARTREPFIEPRLLHGPDFGVVNLVNVLLGGVPLGAIVLAPLYATNRYGIDALASGTLLIAQGLASVVMSVLAVLALRRSGYRAPIAVGGAITAAGLLVLAMAPQLGATPYVWLAGGALLAGVGMGMINPASRNAGLQLAPQHSSSVAAMRSMFMQVGTIVFISVSTAVLAAVRDPGIAQAWIYAVTALAVVGALLALVRQVPEHKGAW